MTGKSWIYLGKKYTWLKDAKFQGFIDCTCKRCQKYMKILVKNKQLKKEIITDFERMIDISEEILGKNPYALQEVAKDV